MPDLFHTLMEHDIGFIKMVAETWGIELTHVNPNQAVTQIVNAVTNPQLLDEIIETLPSEASGVLQGILENGGLLPWAQLERRYGEVRVMGPAKRDRERPDLYPASPAETLWYRGLIGRAFLDIPPEPQEYAYIPDDFLEFIQTLHPGKNRLLGRPASPRETKNNWTVNDLILDHACSLLAGLRMSFTLDDFNRFGWSVPAEFLFILLKDAGLIDTNDQPVPENTKVFLESTRAKSMAFLASTWLNSERINDLLMVPGLKFEGNWQNDPLQTRKNVLNLLSELPQNSWWNLNAFILSVKKQEPDFQRPAGDYDSWFISRSSDGEYLRGFRFWEEVEGELLNYLITGPLHWLGIYDLAGTNQEKQAEAFRPSKWAEHLWHGNIPSIITREEDPVHITSDGKLIISRKTSRAARYQISRFCEWESEKPDGYLYKITPDSLEKAQKQQLAPAHLLKLLQNHASADIPPSLKKALNRWQKFGKQANLKRFYLLQVSSPEILQELKGGSAGRFIEEILNPTTAIVKPGAIDKIQAELVSLGYLTEITQD